ncbi:MAG TPA: TIGR01459 family HAD-type hydrolase [Alphaproteobacteria bacterium]|nr:TIGR01459 family HAD-type hydrolase [Alphaproteobacteria bacterium]
MSLTILNGLSEVVERYELFICDVWGVLHDGLRPYPGVRDCLHRLRERGRKVALLSNAPRPGDNVAVQLAGIGLEADCYDTLLTSGDATREALLRRDEPWCAGLGRRLYHLGPERCLPTVKGLGEAVPLARADVIVCTGLFDDESETPEQYHGLLAPAAARGVPLICANPDRVVMRGERMIPCAGAVADLYAGLGGPVHRYGKPYANVFAAVLEHAGVSDRAHAVMIGDGFLTDIAGAANAGLDSIWVAGGIHAEEVGFADGVPLDAGRIAAVAAAAGERPTAAIGRLVW